MDKIQERFFKILRKYFFHSLSFLLLFLFNLSLSFDISLGAAELFESDKEIVLTNDYLIYKIDKKGFNAAFIDKGTGIDYYDQSRPQPFMGIHIYENEYYSSKIFLDGYNVTVYFGQTGITANVKIIPADKYFIFELQSISDSGVDECILAQHAFTMKEHIGGSVNICWNDKFGACVMGLDLPVHCSPISNNPPILQAKSTSTFGLTHVRYALIGAPGGKLLMTMGDVEREMGLPHPTLGGVWGKISPEVKKSYLFVDFDEENIDKMTDYAKTGGFGYMMTYSGVWEYSAGHYQINSKRYPHGLEGIKNVSDKIHAAGIKTGLHCIIGSVTKNDPYVTPVPDPRLVKESQFILAKDVDENTDEIEVSSSPGDIIIRGEKSMPLVPNEDRRGGTDMQIGDEIFTYRNYTTSQPYKFISCIRGNFGTKRSSHKKGTPVYHISESYGWYFFDAKSSLFEEQTNRVANIINYCGIDMVYFDGVPQYPQWYYMPKVWLETFKKSQRELLIQANSTIPGAWHIISRGCSGDWVSLAAKKHFDVFRLGAYRNYSDNFIPTEFGWYQWLTHGTNRYATFPDEVEYAVQKALGYDAAFCLETNQKDLDQNGRTGEMLETVKNYETLKLSNYFADKIKKELQVPGKEYKLLKNASGDWYFQKIQYSPSYIVRTMDGVQNIWDYNNQFSDQPLQLRLRADWNFADYEDSQNITLLDYKNYFRTETFGTDGINFSLSSTIENVKSGNVSAKIIAENSNSNEQGWRQIRYYLNEPVDINDHTALGVWIYGDSSGAVLRIAIQTAGYLANDRIVEINFKGWKYFELTKPDGDRTFEYPPNQGYGNLRPLDLSQISSVSLYVTNIPEGKTITWYMSPIKALKKSPASLKNPRLILNGQSIILPCVLIHDQYLELLRSGKLIVYDENGRILNEGTVTNIPLLKNGRNSIQLEHDAPDGKTARADVTIISWGEELHN